MVVISESTGKSAVLIILWLLTFYALSPFIVHAVFAADANSTKLVESTYRQARHLYDHGDRAQDVSRALLLFQQAAEAGQREAQLELGVLFDRGIGCERNYEKAAYWYFQAAQQGQPAAQTQLGVLLCQSYLKDNRPLSFTLGTDTVTLPDYEQGAKWLRAAADQGYAPAQMLLGDLVQISYWKGSSFAYWLRKAHGYSAAWYEKAADADMPDALKKVSKELLAAGRYQEAYQYLMAGQKDGLEWVAEPLAQLEPRLGATSILEAQRNPFVPKVRVVTPEWQAWHELIYLANPGPVSLVGTNATDAYARLRAAAEAGDVAAQFRLGLTLQHDEVLLSGRVPTSNGNGQLVLVEQRSDARLLEAIRWYHLAAEKGHTDAQLHLGCIWRYGLTGTNDFARAQKLFEAAARAGSAEAQYQLALLLDEGFADAPQPKAATRWFEKAAAAGHSEAKCSLISRANVTGLAAAPRGEKQRRAARLAILPMQTEQNKLADLLLVELGQVTGLELVEREEIERVLQEQALGAAQRPDYLKIGQLLHADGLLVLETVKQSKTTNSLSQLVAVGPGAVLGAVEVPQSVADIAKVSSSIVRQFSPLWPKLVVTVREAVPVSLLNLRAAISMPGNPGLEQQLTIYLRRRLLHQPELFVLDRTHMEELAGEKLLPGTEGQKFWSGSYLLEGVLNRDGVKPGELTIHLSLTSPGKKRTEYFAAGPDSQPEKILDELTDKVMTELAHGVRHLEWHPLEEAGQYFEEAKWALEQGLFQTSRQAADAAWALGLRNDELAEIRIHSYAQSANRWSFDEAATYEQRQLLKYLLTGAALYFQQTNKLAYSETNQLKSADWYAMGAGMVSIAGSLLERLDKTSASERTALAPQAKQLRMAARGLINYVLPHIDILEQKSRDTFLKKIVFSNALFQEEIKTAVDQMKDYVLSGVYRRALEANLAGSFRRTLILSDFSNAVDGKEKFYKAYRSAFDELAKDSRADVREDIFLGRMLEANSPYAFEDNYSALVKIIWDEREAYSKTDRLLNLWQRLKSELKRQISNKYRDPVLEKLKAEEAGLEARLQPWLVKHEQMQAEVRHAEEEARQAALKADRDKFFAGAKAQQAHMKESMAARSRAQYLQLLDVLKSAKRATPKMLAYLPSKLTEEQALELHKVLLEYRDRVGAERSYRAVEALVARTLKQPSRTDILIAKKVPLYLHGLGVEVPDWKSAHLSDDPKYAPPPPGFPTQAMIQMAQVDGPSPGNLPPGAFPPGRFPPGAFPPGAFPPGARSPTRQPSSNSSSVGSVEKFTLDQFWTFPMRLAGETKDVITAVLAEDAWRDEVILDVFRRSAGTASRTWARLNPATRELRLLQPPDATRRELMPAVVEQGPRSIQRRMVRIGDILYRLSRHGLVSYDLAKDNWDALEVALPGGCKLLSVGQHLFAFNKEGIYHIDPSAHGLKITASIRRRPALTPIDSLQFLNITGAAALGESGVVFNINGSLYHYDLAKEQWKALVSPTQFNQQIVELNSTVLVGIGNQQGTDAYMRMTSANEPFKWFAEIKSLTVGAGYFMPIQQSMQQKDGARWGILQRPYSGGYSWSLSPSIHKEDLLFFHQVMGGGSGDIGRFMLCLRGLPEAIELRPDTSAAPERARKFYLNKRYNFFTTEKFAILTAEDGSGIWMVPLYRLYEAAAKTREKLGILLLEQLKQWPDNQFLIGIKNEKSAY